MPATVLAMSRGPAAFVFMDDDDFPLRLHDHLLRGRALRLGGDGRPGRAAEAGAEDCTITPANS